MHGCNVYASRIFDNAWMQPWLKHDIDRILSEFMCSQVPINAGVFDMTENSNCQYICIFTYFVTFGAVRR